MNKRIKKKLIKKEEDIQDKLLCALLDERRNILLKRDIQIMRASAICKDEDEFDLMVAKLYMCCEEECRDLCTYYKSKGLRYFV